MLKNKKTYYHLILDRSGSMEVVRNETLTGLNEQIQLIRELQERYPEQEFIVNFTWFNHEIENKLVFQKASKVKEFKKQDYKPGGMTALYDAVGHSIQMLNNSAGNEINEDKATAVVVIITDGYENSSKDFSHEKIQSMIKELDANPNWTFSYLGATMDAVDVAASLNINISNARSFDKSMPGKRLQYLSADLEDYAAMKQDGKKSKIFIKDREEE